jgi:hypothetical protein
MANRITNAGLSPANFVSPLSRYADATTIYYGDVNKLTFTTYKRKKVTLSEFDRFTVVNAGTEFRPDLVSLRTYGTVEFWYLIMEVNGIYDITDFVTGLNIRLPNNVF